MPNARNGTKSLTVGEALAIIFWGLFLLLMSWYPNEFSDFCVYYFR